VTIKGVRAKPGQDRIPPKTSTPVEKKKVPPSAEVQEEKRKRIIVGGSKQKV
jgi:hypothetical protein